MVRYFMSYVKIYLLWFYILIFLWQITRKSNLCKSICKRDLLVTHVRTSFACAYIFRCIYYSTTYAVRTCINALFIIYFSTILHFMAQIFFLFSFIVLIKVLLLFNLRLDCVVIIHYMLIKFNIDNHFIIDY